MAGSGRTMPGVTRKIQFDEGFAVFEEQHLTMADTGMGGGMKPMLGGL